MKEKSNNPLDPNSCCTMRVGINASCNGCNNPPLM